MSAEHPEMVKKPTVKAEFMFQSAANLAQGGMAKGGMDTFTLAYTLRSLAMGLRELAIGLRATYLVLDEVRGSLRGLAAPSAGALPGAPAVTGSSARPGAMLDMRSR